MKKFWLSLGLTLILLGGGWQGYQGVGAAPAFGQPYYQPPPPPPGYCDPYYYQCYYTEPYANPLDQFFYYAVPEIGGEIIEQHERREHEGREYREHEGRHERR